MAKLALVTGGARGIGKATADLLRAHGWDVLAPTRAECDFNTHNSIVDYTWKLRRQHDPGLDSVGFVSFLNPLLIDALVFCHGEWFSSDYQNPEDWKLQYRQRVIGPRHLMFYLSSILRGGCVVMVSSTQAFGGRAETGPYGAACAAQVRLIQGLAQSKDGIRYNVVCPGLSATSMAAQVIESGDCRPDAVPQAPEAVAAAIVGLVEGTDNGAVLRVVDGVTTRARWVWE